MHCTSSEENERPSLRFIVEDLKTWAGYLLGKSQVQWVRSFRPLPSGLVFGYWGVSVTLASGAGASNTLRLFFAALDLSN